MLSECFGPTEMRFRLEVQDGAIGFRQVRTLLRVGRVAVPLPRWCSPQASAREAPAGSDRTRTTVELVLPLLGLVIRYAGEVEWRAADEEHGRQECRPHVRS
jgi:hypothetical protein